jgi:hypothetical protein
MPSTKRKRQEESADEPKKKKKSKGSGGAGILLIVLGAVGGLMLLALVVVAAAVVIFVRNRPAPPANPIPIAKDGPIKKVVDNRSRAEVRRYALNIQSARGKLTDAERNIEKVVALAQSFRPQIEQARAAYNGVRAESAGWKAPDDEGAKQLQRSFQEYLALYESQLQWADQALIIRESGANRPFPPRTNAQAFDAKQREVDQLAAQLSR